MKEEDKLKDFVDKHRLEMDVASPPAFSQERLVSRRPKMVKLTSVLKVAAVALVLLSIVGVYLTSLQVGNPVAELPESEVERKIEDISLAMISDELGEMEAYYTKQINETYLELEEEGMIDEVVNDLQLLDEEFEELKKELSEGMDATVVVEEMIENYRMKLKLLENILKKIKQQEDINNKDFSDEKYMVYT